MGKIYPFLAISCALASGQLGLFFLRKHNRVHLLFWLISFVLITTTVLWVIFRGDVNSDRWVRDFFEDNRASSGYRYR